MNNIYYTIFVFIFEVLLTFFFGRKSIILALINGMSSLGTLIFYFYVAFLNPGIPDRNIHYLSIKDFHNPSKQSKYNKIYDIYCPKCELCLSSKSQIYHCPKCDLCIENIDHHCTWIGKCISRKNEKYFNGLIALIMLYFVIALGGTFMVSIGFFNSYQNKYLLIYLLRFQLINYKKNFINIY